MRLFTLKRFNSYQVAVFLSSLSMVFGILREVLIVSLLGFTAKNDLLQIYLSIFYTIGLAIDAMRLSCLNLFSLLSLPRILFSATLVSLPFATGIGLMMNYSTRGMDPAILILTILGSYLNLIAALLITYKQRNNVFLAAQIINVLPNFVLIPGICLCYYFADKNMVLSIVALTSLIPVLQCFFLFLLPEPIVEKTGRNAPSLFAGVLLFLRHFSSTLGEQVLQVITRAAFFNYGPGYLSIYAMSVRLYAALRFILIDSYIGSKLAGWKRELQQGDYYLLKMLNSLSFGAGLVFLSFLLCLQTTAGLPQSALQIALVLSFGFYFSTIVRVIYFKINRHENNAPLVLRFAGYEFIFVLLAYVVSRQLTYPLLALIWLGYIAKPFAQLLFLRKRFFELAVKN